MNEPKVYAEELEDGRVRIQIPGRPPYYMDKPAAVTRKAWLNAVATVVERQGEQAEMHADHVRFLLRTYRKETDQSGAPPFLAEALMSLLAPKNTVQSQLGDLQELFQKNVVRLGQKQARHKYWLQVFGSVGPLLFRWVKRIGFFTVLVDYFRAKFGL